MKRFCAAAILFTLSLSCFAAGNAGVECDFVQTRTMKMMKEAMVSTGHLSCSPSGDLKWEYFTPTPLAFIVTGGRASILKDGRTTPLDQSKGRLFVQMGRMIMDNVNGKAVDGNGMFSVQSAEMEGISVITLTPMKKELGQIMQKFILHFDPKAGVARKVEILGKSGDLTVIEMKNIVISDR